MGKKLITTIILFLGLFLLGDRLFGGSKVIDVMATPTIEVEAKLDQGIQRTDLPEIATSYTARYVAHSAPVSYASDGYGSASVSNYIAISGRNISVVDVGDTAVNAGDHVNKYGPRFYYGHNSGAVFGGLVNYGVGSGFSIYYNGALHNYRVAKVMIFEKNVSNGKLQLNGSGSYMRSVSEARGEGVQYDIALMTCHGTSYGNGDASHRLVVFANEV